MIPTSALVPIIATAAGSLANQLAKAATDGLAFARALHAGEPGDKATAGSFAGPGPGTPPSPAANVAQASVMRDQVNRMRQEVHAELVRHLGRRGVDLSEPLLLTIDGNGRILESGGHWDRATIEQLLETNTQLAGQVRSLFRAQSAWLRAAQGDTGPASESRLELHVDSRQAVFQVVNND